MFDTYIAILAFIISALSFILSCRGFVNSKRAQSFAVQDKKQSILDEYNSIELLSKQNIRKSKSLLHDIERIREILGEHENLKKFSKFIADFKSGSELISKDIDSQREIIDEVDDSNFSKQNLENIMASFNSALNAINKNKIFYIDWNNQINDHEIQIKILKKELNLL